MQKARAEHAGQFKLMRNVIYSHDAAEIVNGDRIWSPDAPQCLLDTSYLQFTDVSKWANGNTAVVTVYIPCTEVFRYFYAATPQVIRETLTGDLLLRPDDFRFAGTKATGDGLRRRHGKPQEDLINTATIDDENALYSQLRNISLSFIANHRSSQRLRLEAFPPKSGRLHLRGDFLRHETEVGETLIAISLDTLSGFST